MNKKIKDQVVKQLDAAMEASVRAGENQWDPMTDKVVEVEKFTVREKLQVAAVFERLVDLVLDGDLDKYFDE